MYMQAERSIGISKYLSTKEEFCSKSNSSNKAAFGLPLNPEESLSISSSTITGFTVALDKAVSILPARAPT